MTKKPIELRTEDFIKIVNPGHSQKKGALMGEQNKDYLQNKDYSSSD